MATTIHSRTDSFGEELDPLREAWTPPEDLSAREVCELPLPEGAEILGPVARAGSRLVIGGKSGEGKTTVVMGMVRAVSQGTQFLDWTGCGGTVLVFDLEQGLRTVQKQLKRNRLHECDNVRYYRIPDGLALENNETQAAWMEGLIVRYQPVMVVLDPLYKAHQGDSNDERAMVDMMRRLDRWRDDHGFCLVIPMHLRKMDPRATDPSMDDIFGSGGLTRGAEVVLGLRKNAPGKSTLYFWKDRDGDLHEESKWKLLFSMQDGFERDPEDKGPEPQEIIERAMLNNGAGVMDRKQIGAATGLSPDKVRSTLAIMLAYETIREEERGANGRKLYRLCHVSDETVSRLNDIAGVTEADKEDGF